MTRISVTVSMRRGGADGRVSASGAERCLGTGRPRSPDPPPCRASDASAGAGGTTGDTGGGCGAGGVAPTPETFMTVLLRDGTGRSARLDLPVGGAAPGLMRRPGDAVPRPGGARTRPGAHTWRPSREGPVDEEPTRRRALTAEDLQHELDAE